MQLAEVLSRAEADLRTISRALSTAGCHADAIRFLGYAGLVAHDIPQKLAAAEAAIKQELARKRPPRVKSCRILSAQQPVNDLVRQQ